MLSDIAAILTDKKRTLITFTASDTPRRLDTAGVGAHAGYWCDHKV